ncbi:response regulator transcription factor [Ferrimicrobium acidiphilum]|uniref:Transcriptional regulatory protein SrrA n=1 Tax=Ferrimicrobium acidiphilum DSM 19497 TaxID=1121877 RepID=A0A0D8FUJ0_9ACTN|nr:response regulator transcription factor [Ferrimicrobium acidiphilum]KJE76953.1 transcriptional regulatory protein SrrA [Ferrimicrobium acidiphilum DSM 19497]
MTTVAVYSPKNVGRVIDFYDDTGYEFLTIDSEETTLPSQVTGVIVDATTDFEQAVTLCRGIRKHRDSGVVLLLLIERHQVKELALREGVIDDFAVSPFDRTELAVRLQHLLARHGQPEEHSRIAIGPLMLDTDTYQATLAGTPMDLTYMEYELLKFLASHPGKVFSRETLLSRVWGYEYYGGARTVDVHIRRLRAKLGEAYDSLIQTVRSVGYKFGLPSELLDDSEEQADSQTIV